MSYKLRLPAAVKIGYVLGMEGLFLIFVVNRDKATDTVNGIHFFLYYCDNLMFTNKKHRAVSKIFVPINFSNILSKFVYALYTQNRGSSVKQLFHLLS